MFSSLANRDRRDDVLESVLNDDAQLRDVVIAPRKKQRSTGSGAYF